MNSPRKPSVEATRHGRVSLLLCENPPVNAIGHGIREGLFRNLVSETASEDVDAIVIACGGSAFFAGADISEFSGEEQPPTADGLIDLIEGSPKPVVAAMHSRALGGGLELALACHYRVAAPGTVFGFPEVTLGLIPGLGGTQRFARIAGFAEALRIIPTGETIDATRAEAIGLLDRVVDSELPFLDEAVAFAAGLGCPPHDLLVGRLARNCQEAVDKARLDRASFQEARERLARRYRKLSAPQAAVDAIGAALDLPFEDALANERRIFNERLASSESQALTHLFFAERAARKVSTLDSAPAEIGTVGIVGGGTMGRGILIAVIEAGFAAVLVERDEKAARACLEAVEGHLRRKHRTGSLSEADIADILGRTAIGADWSGLEPCDLVIEAVFEKLDLKREIFGQLAKVTRPDAVLATNTSGLSVARIAEAAARPENVIGLHFFSPANVMKLLEIVQAPLTSGRALATSRAFARRLGKVAVVAKDADGFIGNRIFDRYWREAELMVEDGVSPYDVDAALEDFGMAMGPFAVSDLAGLDLGHDIRIRQAAAVPAGTRVPTMEERLFQAGRLGQKNGAGWYDYPDGKRMPSPRVLDLLHGHKPGGGAYPSAPSSQDIVLTCMTALLGEAFRVLDEGVAARASDIDLVAVHGYGFPKFVGGPMHWFETVGLSQIRSWNRRALYPVSDEILQRFDAGRSAPGNISGSGA
jgi:3-hydroxyacyl-CoA dehydrogenase